jgi:predicted aldo/keto reductase-like oxidoreductase
MYEEAYGNPALARSTYHEIPLSASASTCLNCSQCVSKCVNGLDISEKMKRARKLLV